MSGRVAAYYPKAEKCKHFCRRIGPKGAYQSLRGRREGCEFLNERLDPGPRHSFIFWVQRVPHSPQLLRGSSPTASALATSVYCQIPNLQATIGHAQDFGGPRQTLPLRSGKKLVAQVMHPTGFITVPRIPGTRQRYLASLARCRPARTRIELFQFNSFPDYSRPFRGLAFAIC